MMKKTWLLFVLAFLLSFSSIWVSAADGYPCTDLKASSSGSSSIDVSDGSVTMTVQGARTSEKNGTLTLTNEGDVAAQLSFSYSATGTYGSFTLAGETVDASGSYNAEIAAGGTVVLYMTVPKSGLFSSAEKGYIALTNVKLEVASDAEVTVSHNAAGTISIDGTTIKSGSTVDIPASGAVLVATPGTGATFLGWVNTVDNSVVSTSANFSYVPTGDASLKAIFAHADSEACFWGSSKSYLFESLSTAVSYASSASNKTIVLAASGTLSAGNYTVPSGITLLLPFDSAGTCYSDSPGYDTGYTPPTAYCTLTMKDGANITVEEKGAISVSAKVSAKMGYAGAPTSKYGHIAMKSGSTITVKSGGNLYAWGYISGDGNVLIKSGATVYESFQVVDWRGGTATTGMLNNKEKVFPMSQYYIQNVEAHMTLESGASENCSMVADIISVRQVVVPFMGKSGCMFNLTSGTASKRYDGGTDRIVLDINGDFTISDTTITFLGSYGITLSKYVLPLGSNYTLNVDSGTLNFATSTSLLPGSQVNIAEGASVKVTNGAQLFVYDETEWKSDYYVYSNAYFRPVRYAVGKTGTRENDDIIDAKIIVNGTLDASAGYLYTTASGASICSTGNGVVKLQAPESAPTLNEATQSGTDISYSSISVTAAQLQHADGTYLSTGAGTYNYSKDHGRWVKGEHAANEKLAATCTEAGYDRVDCSCGYSHSEVFPALGHKSSDWSAPVDGYELCTCTVCKVELAKRLYSALDLEYRLNDYIWMNATVQITASGTVKLDDTYGDTIFLVSGNDGTYYLVRKVLSTDLTSDFVVTLSIDGVKTVDLDLSFENFANSLPAEHPHKNLVNAMINYGKAADDYFPDVDEKTHFTTQFTFAEICTAAEDTTPVDKMQALLAARNEYNGAKLRTAGATIDFANCLGMVLRFKATEDIELAEGDSIVQIGFLVGTDAKYMTADGTATELTDESYDSAYIYYGATEGAGNGSGNTNNTINGALSGVVDAVPDDLSQEMRLRFDMTRAQYIERFALRPFIVIRRANGTYLNLYGEQVLYGFEDYCARTFAKDSASLQSKNLVVYAWKYALEAERATFEGE